MTNSAYMTGSFAEMMPGEAVKMGTWSREAFWRAAGKRPLAVYEYIERLESCEQELLAELVNIRKELRVCRRHAAQLKHQTAAGPIPCLEPQA